jgi:hypothetical protein
VAPGNESAAGRPLGAGGRGVSGVRSGEHDRPRSADGRSLLGARAAVLLLADLLPGAGRAMSGGAAGARIVCEAAGLAKVSSCRHLASCGR